MARVPFDGKSLVTSTNGTKRASKKHKRGGFKLEFDEKKHRALARNSKIN